MTELHPTYCGMGKACTCSRIDFCTLSQPSDVDYVYEQARLLSPGEIVQLIVKLLALKRVEEHDSSQDAS